MKNRKWFLAIAIVDVLAGLCFGAAAIGQTESLAKCLFGIAAVGMLVSGAGFFCTYCKMR